MSKKQELIDFLRRDDIKKIFEDINVEHLYLVWSYARWEQTEDSDIDLVYKEKENSRIWWLKFIKNKLSLEKKLKKKIDLVNEDFIYSDVKSYINKDKILIY